MKKLLKSVMALALVITLTGCGNKAAKEFKNEYESINGQKTSETSERVFREVSINKNNVFEKVSAEDIVKKIENKETFYLYVGDKKCPWCRSVIEKATEVSISKKIDKIYYVNIWDEEYNEILRDKYVINESGKLEKTVEGTDAYKKLLEYFDSVLSDYNLTDSEGGSISTGEKRIYAPNYFYVKNGEVQMMVTGQSEKQTGAYDELTEEMLKDEEEIFTKFFNLADSCSLEEAC